MLSVCFAEFKETDFMAPAEADAIIARREAEQAERKANRLSELEKATVLSEGVDYLPDGRKVIIREVEPPENVEASLAKPVPGPEAIAPVLTAEQLAWIEGQSDLRSHKVQMLSCTVYDRSITQVRWTHEGERYLAYTNADFNYLRGVMTVETETDRFDYFFGIGNSKSKYLKHPLPTLPAFSPDRSEYALVKGNPSNLAATAGLEALLAHYDANLDSLKIAHQRNEALTAAQKRYDEAHPEQPEDFILQFWVPEKKEGSK